MKAHGKTGHLAVQQVSALSEDLSLQVYFQGVPLIHCMVAETTVECLIVGVSGNGEQTG